MKQLHLKSSVWLLLAALVIVLDQWTKWIATTNLVYARPVEVFPGLNWTLLHNTGAAFSFLSDAGGWQHWLFIGLAIAISLALTIWMFAIPKNIWMRQLPLALIIGGAVGNVIDRIRLGYVVDFIDVYVGSSHWPAFNIADSAICVGAVGFIVLGYIQDKRDERETQAA